MLNARPPCRRIPDITNVILAREVIVCANILLLGARYDPADLRSLRADRIAVRIAC